MLRIWRKARTDRLLQQAICHQDGVRLVKALRKGADPTRGYALKASSRPARSPLQHCIDTGFSDGVRLLLSHTKTHPEQESEQAGLLIAAIQHPQNSLALLNALLLGGIRAQALSSQALFACLALPANKVSLHLDRLLQYGADIHAQDAQQKTLLYHLLQREDQSTLGMLINAGASLPSDLDRVNCSSAIKQFALRLHNDLATRRLLDSR